MINYNSQEEQNFSSGLNNRPLYLGSNRRMQRLAQQAEAESQYRNINYENPTTLGRFNPETLANSQPFNTAISNNEILNQERQALAYQQQANQAINRMQGAAVNNIVNYQGTYNDSVAIANNPISSSSSSNIFNKDTETMAARVYIAYRKQGLTPSQAIALTAEVGRENGYNKNILFGGHIDPATRNGKSVSNVGMMSWNGDRGSQLIRFLSDRGLYQNGKMIQSQEALDAMAEFSVRELNSPAYRKRLKNFFNNPNASPEAYAPELGKHYVGWAYGQNTIQAGKGRKPFNWTSHDERRRQYASSLTNLVQQLENNT